MIASCVSKTYARPLLALFLACCHLHADAQTFPDFKPLRYDEDYSRLQGDSSANGWYKRLKHTYLSRHSFISFGGDTRIQYFHIENEAWGDAPKDTDGFVLARFLVHADLHAGRHFRVFAQTQSSLSGGQIGPGPVDDNPLELHQAFTDVNFNPEATSKLSLRLGRQELSYGSQRLVSVRDGPNNRQSFDAVKLMLASKNYKTDLFFSHYVAAATGIFDDGFNRNSQFWGSYTVLNDVPFVRNIDLYYLGIWKRNAVYDDSKGEERRHSLGTRLWGKYGSWKYDVEALYQFGTSGEKSIGAWTASLNTTYTLEQMFWKPELGLKTELISGDRRHGDDRLQTFSPLFPRGAYFGLAALIGPSNLIDLHPSISFQVHPRLNWNIDYDIFWRESSEDGIYAPNGAMIYSGRNVPDRSIGKQLSTELVYAPQPFLYMRAEFTWFQAGNYLKQVGTGKDILFSGVTAQIRF